MIRFSCAIVILLLLGACGSLRQEVGPGYLNEESQKLVLISFISPQDTMVSASLSLSQPVLGEEPSTPQPITNATLTLSDGSREATLRTRTGQNPALFYYYLPAKEFPVVAGRTYTLTARVPDGRQVTAQTTVPVPVQARDVLLDSVQTLRDGRRNKEFFVRLRWNDPAGTADFYRVAGVFRYQVANATRPDSGTNLVNFSRNRETRDLVADGNNDGQLLISSRGFFLNNTVGTTVNFSTVLASFRRASFVLDLLHVDTHYHRYHDAISRQDETGGNPFAEPVLIPSNVVGGLGCFGSFNRTTLQWRLK